MLLFLFFVGAFAVDVVSVVTFFVLIVVVVAIEIVVVVNLAFGFFAVWFDAVLVVGMVAFDACWPLKLPFELL